MALTQKEEREAAARRRKSYHESFVAYKASAERNGWRYRDTKFQKLADVPNPPVWSRFLGSEMRECSHCATQRKYLRYEVCHRDFIDYTTDKELYYVKCGNGIC